MSGIIFYIWQKKLLKSRKLYTTNGKELEIIDYGTLENGSNTVNNAKVRIGDRMYNGNIILHDRENRLEKNHSTVNDLHSNAILHVTTNNIHTATVEEGTANWLQIKCAKDLEEEYEAMERHGHRLPCTDEVSKLDNIVLHSLLSRLLVERIEEKARKIGSTLNACGMIWDDTLFRTIARSFGFGIQGNVFELWANRLDMQALGKHRDNIMQVEAIMFGQAGLLNPESIPHYYREAALKSSYFNGLLNEYMFLSKKFGLEPMDFRSWGTSNATPHLRIARLAAIYHNQKVSMSNISSCDTTMGLRKLLETSLNGYWQNHTCFGGTETCGNPPMKERHCDIVIINAIVPTLFIFGKRHSDTSLCNKAEDFLYLMKSEENSIIKRWREQGISVKCAADSQALLQLSKKYCSTCNCKNCHFAYHYIKRRLATE